MIKKILMAILIICISLILPNNVYAEFTVEDNGDDNGSGTTGSTEIPTGPPTGPGSLSCDSSSGWTATCKVKKSSKRKNTYGAYAWDMNNNYLGDIYDDEIEGNLEKLGLKGILAGTYVKLQIYEEKTVTIETKVTSTGIQEYHDCIQHVQRTCYRDVTLDGTTKTEKYDCSYDKTMRGVKGTSCPRGYESTETYYKYTDSCNSARLQCRDSNPPPMPNVSPSFTLNLSDSNDAKNNELSLSSTQAKEVSSSIIDEKGNWYWKKGVTKKFTYSIEKICINVKTGKVKYIKKTDECDKNNEYEIAADEGKWKYFIPLNANSKEDFSLSLKEITGSGIMTPGLCRDAMKKKPNNYRSFIKSAGEEFTGIYEEDKDKLSNGCYSALNIIIPITQKFYNEQNNGTFKGFNFYYKPIDVNNSFPNGIPESSIWTQNDIDKLTDTYSEENKTYEAIITNTEKIRNYNKNNPYTSWANMKVNGTSNFINGQFVVRNDDVVNFYKLGCGPANEDKKNGDGTTNFLYQQECGTE